MWTGEGVATTCNFRSPSETLSPPFSIVSLTCSATFRWQFSFSVTRSGMTGNWWCGFQHKSIASSKTFCVFPKDFLEYEVMSHCVVLSLLSITYLYARIFGHFSPNSDQVVLDDSLSNSVAAKQLVSPLNRGSVSLIQGKDILFMEYSSTTGSLNCFTQNITLLETKSKVKKLNKSSKSFFKRSCKVCSLHQS